MYPVCTAKGHILFAHPILPEMFDRYIYAIEHAIAPQGSLGIFRYSKKLWQVWQRRGCLSVHCVILCEIVNHRRYVKPPCMKRMYALCMRQRRHHGGRPLANIGRNYSNTLALVPVIVAGQPPKIIFSSKFWKTHVSVQ